PGGRAGLGAFGAQRPAAHVLAYGPLHLDDVGAEQRELVARIGASQHLREVENLHAFERSGQFSFLRRGWLKEGSTDGEPSLLRQTRSVCARERSDEAIHSSFVVLWIASLRSQ